MSKNTVRKEVAHSVPVSGTAGTQGLSAVDEFEAFFAEQFRPAPVAAVPAASAPVTAAPAAAPFHDPLMAELARIVGQGGMQRPALRAVEAAPAPVAPEPVDPLMAFENELRRFDEMHRAAAQKADAPVAAAVYAEVPAEQAPVPAPHFDPVAALEEELRRYEASQMAPAEPVQDLRGVVADAAVVPPYPAPEIVADPFASQYQQPVPELDVPAVVAAPEAKPRSRKVVMMLSTAAIVAVAGVVGAVAMKSGKRPLGGEPPVIAAKGQPMKEKPADPGGAEIPGQNRQVLAKGSSEPTSPANVVNKEEQPVDLNQTPKRDVARVILPPSNGAGGAAPSAQAAAPIIMPPTGAGAAQTQEPSAAPNGGGFEAKRVRSVKVGPDGAAAPSVPSMVAAAPVPAAPAPVAPAPVAAAPVAPKPVAATPVAATPPAAPKAETRTATATPKSDARPSTAARAQTTTPQPTRQVATRPAVPAASDDDEDEAENKPMSLRPPSGTAPTRQVAARTTAPATTASTGGGFSVQLGAPPSEEEARRMANSMRQKHSSALAGSSPSVRAATVGEKTVYRVRVGGLSRDRANQMCSAIKSNGGSCFVAGN